MKPTYDYIIIEEVKRSDDVTAFKAEGDESSIALGKIIAVSSSQDSNNELTFEDEDVGKKVLYRRHAFEEYNGQLYGEIKNIIALQEDES